MDSITINTSGNFADGGGLDTFVSSAIAWDMCIVVCLCLCVFVVFGVVWLLVCLVDCLLRKFFLFEVTKNDR